MANIFDNTQTMNRCRLCLDRPGGMVRIDEDVFGRHLEMLFHVQVNSHASLTRNALASCFKYVHYSSTCYSFQQTDIYLIKYVIDA